MKGLSIILEQSPEWIETTKGDYTDKKNEDKNEKTPKFYFKKEDGKYYYMARPVLKGYDDIPSTTPTPNTNQNTNPTPTDTAEKDIMARLDKMFEVFSAYDITKKSTNYVEKLSTNDRKMVKSNTLERIKTETNNDLSKLTKETLDDTFVKHLIKYMITDKNMTIFFIQYTPTGDYKIKPEQIFEAKGLAKLLSEQGYSPNEERIYILYKTGDNFELISGLGAPNEAAATYNKRVGQAVSGPDKNTTETGEAVEQVSEKPSVKEKRPEEELGLKNNKLLNDIYKRASDEGIDSAKDLIEIHFSSRQKRIIKSMNGEGYVVLRPINPDMYEEMDVKARYSEDFEPFKEFKMYKLMRDGVNVETRTESIKQLSEFQKITKKVCKEMIEQYYDMGVIGDFDIEDEQRKSAARQVYRCRRQHKFGGKLDFSGISEKLDKIGGTSWAQDPNSGRFAINYNNQTVGTDDNVISLKR